jgi:predicted ATP-binding protein involved in virulence
MTNREKDLNKSTFVSEIKINKVRHLENINIFISSDKPKHLFLTGKNGSGKTSFLEEAENHFQRILEMPKNEMTTQKNDNKFQELATNFPLHFNYNSSVLDMQLKYESGNYTIAFFKDERKLKGLEKAESIVPIEFKTQSLPKDDYTQKLVKYLIWQDYKKKSDINNQQIEQFFIKIQSILKRIYKDKNLLFNIDLKDIEFGKPLNFNISLSNGNCFNLEQMAAGYSSIFRIIFELILRMEAKPEKENTEGIVLIDEPETHLHVEMQKEIMPILIEMFPNVQFIIATHSPFILNSVENAVVFDLGKKILVENMSGYSYDSIIENYYDSDKYSQIVKAKLEEYEKLYFKNNLSEEEEERLLDFKIYFKDIPKFLSPELSVKLQQIHSSKINRL